MIVVIFLGLGGSWRLGGGRGGEIFKIIIWRASHKELGPFFMGAGGDLNPPDTKKRFSLGNWRRARLNEMIKKWRRERFYMSCNYSCTILFWVKILLAKLKNLYIQHAWISIMKKQSSSRNVKVEKMVVLTELLTITIASLILVIFFSCPVKLWKNWNWNLDRNLIMTIYKVLFENLYTVLTLLAMGLFWGSAHGLVGSKRLPFLKYALHILQWWHSYTLPKENQKNI